MSLQPKTNEYKPPAFDLEVIGLGTILIAKRFQQGLLTKAQAVEKFLKLASGTCKSEGYSDGR